MGCDIHCIVEIRKDNKWQYIPELPEQFDYRNYSIFGAIAEVRDYFNQCIFEPKGLPDDISGIKFRFDSEREYMQKCYNEDSVKCLVIDNKPICEEYDNENELYRKTKIKITEMEYETLCKMEKDSWNYKSRYTNLTKYTIDKTICYYVNDASQVNGEWKYIPFKELYSTFEEFTKTKVYQCDWDNDAQDWGYWTVDFDCEDYHDASYISLEEFHNANYDKYTAKKFKLDKEFVEDFIESCGKFPDNFTIEQSPMCDIAIAVREAMSPTVTIAYQPKEKSGELFDGIKELENIAKQYNVEDKDIRIVFAFDN